VFNNGKFDEGGRFYGGWWQLIPNDPQKGTAYRHQTPRRVPTEA
jgi:hypothetical protein